MLFFVSQDYNMNEISLDRREEVYSQNHLAGEPVLLILLLFICSQFFCCAFVSFSEQYSAKYNPALPKIFYCSTNVNDC